MTTQTEYENMSAAEKKKEDWMNTKWRPMMGWLYMAVCAFDFVIFPILWSVLHAVTHATTITQWQPLTLQGAGLFHIAMGAVLGIAAFGRTQEKLNGANNGGLQQPAAFSVPPAAPSSFQAPAAPSFPAASTPNSFGGSSFGSTPRPAPAAPAAVGFSSSGKPMPAQPDQPEL